jgi:hypothetical protein
VPVREIADRVAGELAARGPVAGALVVPLQREADVDALLRRARTGARSATPGSGGRHRAAEPGDGDRKARAERRDGDRRDGGHRRERAHDRDHPRDHQRDRAHGRHRRADHDRCETSPARRHGARPAMAILVAAPHGARDVAVRDIDRGAVLAALADLQHRDG